MLGSPRTVWGLEDLEACEGVTNEHLFTLMVQSSTLQSIDDHRHWLPQNHTINTGDQLRFSAGERREGLLFTLPLDRSLVVERNQTLVPTTSIRTVRGVRKRMQPWSTAGFLSDLLSSWW